MQIKTEFLKECSDFIYDEEHIAIEFRCTWGESQPSYTILGYGKMTIPNIFFIN